MKNEYGPYKFGKMGNFKTGHYLQQQSQYTSNALFLGTDSSSSALFAQWGFLTLFHMGLATMAQMTISSLAISTG